MTTEPAFVPAYDRDRLTAWLAPLTAKRIGVETMGTPAACRTYNVLSQEGRPVLAALLVE